MMKHGVILALLSTILPSQPAWTADIHQRTAILCVSQDTESLVSVPEYAGTSNSDKVVSSFTQWMFDVEKEPRPSKIRFLWIPPTSKSPPDLKFATTDTNHSVIRILSQTRHGILAATSASVRKTNVGWMFAINFKAEHVIATSVFSNLGGGRSQAFNYSCRFDNQTPEVQTPAPASGVG